MDLPSSIGALNFQIDRDAGRQWKTTQSFGRNDLLVLAKVADRAHSCIFELQRAEDESEQAVGNRSALAASLPCRWGAPDRDFPHHISAPHKEKENYLERGALGRPSGNFEPDLGKKEAQI